MEALAFRLHRRTRTTRVVVAHAWQKARITVAAWANGRGSCEMMLIFFFLPGAFWLLCFCSEPLGFCYPTVRWPRMGLLFFRDLWGARSYLASVRPLSLSFLSKCTVSQYQSPSTTRICFDSDLSPCRLTPLAAAIADRRCGRTPSGIPFLISGVVLTYYLLRRPSAL